MLYKYAPKGVCSRMFIFDISEDNKINSLEVIGGCQGNLKGISKIIVGMDIDKVIENFQNIDCEGKGTSCPDQIAKALIEYKKR